MQDFTAMLLRSMPTGTENCEARALDLASPDPCGAI
jgi:hypothetical protein